MNRYNLHVYADSPTYPASILSAKNRTLREIQTIVTNLITRRPEATWFSITLTLTAPEPDHTVQRTAPTKPLTIHGGIQWLSSIYFTSTTPTTTPNTTQAPPKASSNDSQPTPKATEQD